MFIDNNIAWNFYQHIINQHMQFSNLYRWSLTPNFSLMSIWHIVFWLCSGMYVIIHINTFIPCTGQCENSPTILIHFCKVTGNKINSAILISEQWQHHRISNRFKSYIKLILRSEWKGIIQHNIICWLSADTWILHPNWYDPTVYQL